MAFNLHSYQLIECNRFPFSSHSVILRLFPCCQTSCDLRWPFGTTLRRLNQLVGFESSFELLGAIFKETRLQTMTLALEVMDFTRELTVFIMLSGFTGKDFPAVISEPSCIVKNQFVDSTVDSGADNCV